MTPLLAVIYLVSGPIPRDAVQGGVTFYPHEKFEGNGLKCPGYKYEPETGPWIAVDASWYRTGKVKCGDLFLVVFADGTQMYARALDSGHLDEHSVHDSGKPFVADCPDYWRNKRKTGTGWIINLDAIMRQRMN